MPASVYGGLTKLWWATTNSVEQAGLLVHVPLGNEAEAVTRLACRWLF